MLKDYFEKIDDIKWMTTMLASKDPSQSEAGRRLNVYKAISEYSEEERQAFKNLLFVIDKSRENKYVNALKDIYMEAYLNRLCNSIEDASSENQDAEERLLGSLRNRFSEFSNEEVELLNTAVTNKYNECEKYLNTFSGEVRNFFISNQSKCEMIGSALSDLKYIEKQPKMY